MNRQALRLVVVLGAVSVVGLLLIQFLWIRQAYVTESRTFDHNVNLALRNVVESLCQYEGQEFPTHNAIEQVSANYYIVRTAQVLQPGTLEYFLGAELTKRNILTDFEYGIYDCQSEKMVYGSAVKSSASQQTASFPTLEGDSYYFGVLFPSRQKFLMGKIDFLMYVSGGLLAVIVFFCYAVVTITRQKKLSEVQRDFINSMTHEFKTPLSTIRLSAEVIRSQPSAASARLLTYANLIEKEAQRLQYHVEEVLQVALIEKSKLRLNITECNLDELLQDFVEFGREKVSSAGGKWLFENEAGNVKIRADILHFQNVLNNLLDNSLKYTTSSPVIKVKTSVADRRLLLQFSDNGIGVEGKDLKHIFKKFYRVPAANAHGVAGFGLGLYYVRQIVAAHGGKISIRSHPGFGTTFLIDLPLSETV